jgi:hypothetical protein
VQNFSIGKNFGYQDAIAQLSFAPAFTVSLGEVSRKVCYNLFAIFGTLTLEYFGLNAIALGSPSGDGWAKAFRTKLGGLKNQ